MDDPNYSLLLPLRVDHVLHDHQLSFGRWLLRKNGSWQKRSVSVPTLHWSDHDPEDLQMGWPLLCDSTHPARLHWWPSPSLSVLEHGDILEQRSVRCKKVLFVSLWIYCHRIQYLWPYEHEEQDDWARVWSWWQKEAKWATTPRQVKSLNQRFCLAS